MQSRPWEKIQSGKCLLSVDKGLTPAQTPTPIGMAACEGTWKVETEHLLGGAVQPPRLGLQIRDWGSGDQVQLVESLPNMHKALNSVPSTT